MLLVLTCLFSCEMIISFEAIHRPWLTYGMTALSKFVKRQIILPSMGFRKVQATSVPLTAWHRPSSVETKDVCLFWHGIAPGGLVSVHQNERSLL